jgi:[protein-PII] uridylyltransferase
MVAPRLKPIRIEQVIDGLALRAQLSAAHAEFGENARAAVCRLLREALFRGRTIAQERLSAGENGLAVARLLAQIADEVVSALYDYTTTHIFRARNPTQGERLAIVAVGGYGRGELAPFSDLDLLFLRAYKPTPFDESVTEYMLYLLWDLQLKVGQSARNIDECLKLARDDHTVQTALLEARYIAGDRALAQDLFTRFRKEVASRDHPAYIAAKLTERDERHARQGASRYMVEPNIKEGKGGLRDLHTLFWMARRHYGFVRPRDYVEAGVFTNEERSSLRRALEFLWTVRCHMHFVTGRAEERLTFDLQPELANRMGYGARGGQSAVERFMKRYFLVAKETGALTRTLCAQLEADHAKQMPKGLQRFLPGRAKTTPIEPGFCIDGGRLNTESDDVLASPVNVLRLFAVAAKHDLDIHPAAFGQASRRARSFGAEWRRHQETRGAFLEVMESKRQAAALRLMNEAGVLGKFVPEFGRIVAQMQFNMYHHFTVDEHTLRAIDAMSEIENGRHRDQHPLASEIFAKIINRRALYLAMLLHDTGKGGGDQQVEGEKAARAACERLGLPREEVDLIGWLVRHHLVMSDVAQKRDIGDPRTVAQFAEIVGSVERLRLLLVLTVADIRAVGNVWNDWKGQLLRDLYRLTEAVLHGGRSDEQSVRNHLAEIAETAKKELLAGIGGARAEALDAWLGALDDGYWLNHDADALKWHALEVMRARTERSIPHIATRIREAQGVSEVLVYAGDRPGLFASLASAISACGADIVGARVHTSKDGAAVDVFSIQTSGHKPFGIDDPRMLAALTIRLTRAALSDHAPPPAAPPSRRNAAFTIEPWVRIDNEITPDATVIEASGRDRLGLLAELAHVCAEAKVSIVSAHIDTYGERASDVFYVQEEGGGGQIANPLRIAAVRDQLENVLRAAEPADPTRAPLAVAPASTAR